MTPQLLVLTLGCVLLLLIVFGLAGVVLWQRSGVRDAQASSDQWHSAFLDMNASWNRSEAARSLAESAFRASEERGRVMSDWIALAAASEPADADAPVEETPSTLAGLVGPAPAEPTVAKPAISDEDLDAAVEMREFGATWKELAEALGVAESTVRKHVTRRSGTVTPAPRKRKAAA